VRHISGHIPESGKDQRAVAHQLSNKIKGIGRCGEPPTARAKTGLKPEYLYYVVPKAGLADEATIQRTWWVPAAN